ncbi:LysR family transcriptional regulator [Dactylosporangium aurantiacum]|uniref:LysR family transcriptional regulator n=1 Tax=Dactylosporangium aurantiacum TaxID=35754 RepID=A0A9Q9IJS3_9ACTN|nr:LysR substrate-binding domain-containing protein [Dactylosporangium aurantiacum]MDG6104487.1 LysR substrate-binding domain-containing protein [Dactylosporangium aurantiacum]UWZ56103.1 LysR family transcriptional regulator [Dactylosporangium aurantiacum]
MELHQLAYLVAVADEASFTRAAARLRVAQPGVSAQVRKLERELGQDLLDRSGRQVRLTAAGAAVLPYARAALAAVEGARRTAAELAGLVRGRVAIGTVTSHDVDLATVLADFHAAHPGLEITLAEDTTDRLVDGLRAGRLDAAIIAYDTPPPDLDVRVLTDEAVDAAVAPGHEWAGRSTVRVAELRGRPLVCLRAGTGIRGILESACAAAGFAPVVAFEAGTPQVVAQLAARGLGVAVLPASIARGYAGLHPLRITRPALSGRLGLAWRREGPRPAAAGAFLSHFARYR